MNPITVELPASTSPEEARLLLARKLFEVGRLSCGWAAELEGYSKSVSLEESLGKHEAPTTGPSGQTGYRKMVSALGRHDPMASARPSRYHGPMTPALNQILSEFRRGLVRIYGGRLSQVVLFGSQARGDAEPDSDIDVLVVLKGPVRPGAETAAVGPLQADVSLRHDCVVSCVFMDEDRYRQRNGPLLRNIRREGLPV